MTTDEVLVFKNFEDFMGRDEDGSTVRSCFRTAFTDPGTPKTAEPRHSSEYRVAVWFSRLLRSLRASAAHYRPDGRSTAIVNLMAVSVA